MLVECVPNFSEGRKGQTVERIAQAIESVKGANVLDRHLDGDHNRSVITFVARPEHIVEAALRAVATAAKGRMEGPMLKADLVPGIAGGDCTG